MNHLFQHIQGHLYGAFRPRLLPTGGASAWTPLSLFASNEEGLWFDPSDFSTMFQDSAGTTPVTTVEQPVGLILDKRLGLALGSELVIYPLDGAASDAWVVSATSVTRNGSSGGGATVSVTGTNLLSSKTYLITLTVADFSGDALFFRAGSGGVLGPISANGAYSYSTPGGDAGGLLFSPWVGAAGEATITNISVREIAGNHAIQATAAARPVVSAPAYINYDGIDDAIAATLPNLGTDATVARAVPMVGTTILTGQTIGAGTWTDSTDHAGLVIIDRALTAGETAALTAYLDAKAGV